MPLFIEACLDETADGRCGFLGVGPAHFDLEQLAVFGSQHHQVHDAFAIGHAAIAENPDLGSELPRELGQSARHPEMKPGPIGNHHSSLARTQHDCPPSFLGARDAIPRHAPHRIHT